MPSVFLSYARADAIRVKSLEQRLREQGIEIWRDQESLYGGQQWPKAIGEAIASRDFFLLVWSKTAASSHFVEFEWTTAVALRKPLIPCLLDDTPLPLALRAVQGIDVNAPEISALLSAAIQAAPLPPPPESHVSQVLGQLGGIATSAPDQVASQAKAMYAQQGWSVQGNVYQANGNIYVTVQQPVDIKQEKSILETWSKRLALVAVVLGIIISLFTLQGKIKEMFFPESATTPLRGIVVEANDAQQPIPDAIVTVQELPGKSQTTTSDGGFVFDKVPGNPGDRVRVLVKKPEYKDHNEYVALPGPKRITIERVSK
jgi:hypothetical protein